MIPGELLTVRRVMAPALGLQPKVFVALPEPSVAAKEMVRGFVVHVTFGVVSVDEGFRSSFDYAQCIRTFHFLQKPVDALQGMFNALKPSGECLVTFETDNFLRRLLLFFGIGTSEQYYYKISDVENMFRKVGFRISRSGCVMRTPVTIYRRCPRLVLPILRRLERLWPWPMHDYVLGEK